MQRIQFLLTLMLAMALLISQPTHAQTGNIGFNIQQVIDDLSAGLNGEYEYDGSGWGLEIDGNFQSGDIYRGKGTRRSDLRYILRRDKSADQRPQRQRIYTGDHRDKQQRLYRTHCPNGKSEHQLRGFKHRHRDRGERKPHRGVRPTRSPNSCRKAMTRQS